MRCRNDTNRIIPVIAVQGTSNLPAQWKHVQVGSEVDLQNVTREEARHMGFTVLVGNVKDEKKKVKEVKTDEGSGMKSLLPSP